MNRIVWLVLGSTGCVIPTTRAPQGSERSMALTAEDLMPHAIKPETVERSAEEWSVRHGSDGWSLKYGYDRHGLSVAYQATLSSSVATAKANWGSSGLLGSAVGRMQGVELTDGDAVPWGDESECKYVRISDLDVGFDCRGRSGRRTWTVSVYGVSPHGGGAPAALLQGPLRALSGWEPDEEPPTE